MTRADLVAGVRHTWYVARAELIVDWAYTLLLLGAVVITGGPLLLPVPVAVLALVRTASTVYRMARNSRESRAFYEEFLANWNPEDAHQ